MSGLPEPWRLTIGPVRKRLSNQNPAVLDVLDANLESWEAGLHTLVSQGATDEEIWQGDWLTLLPLPVRQLLPELLVTVRQQWLEEKVTADAVRAERGRRIADGEPYGYDVLATHFRVSETTIRRRLGVIGGKKNTLTPP